MRYSHGSLAQPMREVPFARLLAVLLLAACTSSARPLPSVPAAPLTQPALTTPIKHIVIIVQENRSFENLFAGFPGADAPMHGYDLAGNKIQLRTVDFIHWVNLNHDFAPAIRSWNNGKMNGFNGTMSGLPANYPYGHLDRKE